MNTIHNTILFSNKTERILIHFITFFYMIIIMLHRSSLNKDDLSANKNIGLITVALQFNSTAISRETSKIEYKPHLRMTW